MGIFITKMKLKTKPCRYGVMTFPVNDYYIGGALEQEGVYGPAEVEKLLSLIDSDSVVIEVGAHIGSITVPLGKKANRIYAFEPQPEIYECLIRNIEQNNLRNVVCERMGLAELPGFAKASAVDDSAKVNTGGMALAVADQGGIKITTLDCFIDSQHPPLLSRVDLIKVDVEGMEGKVIAGALKTISRFKPLLYVENDRPDKSVALIEQIIALGYTPYWHLPPIYNPDPTQEAGMVSVNMLCVPPGKLVDVSDCIPIRSAHDDWTWALQQSKQSVPRPVEASNSWACVVRLGGIGDNLMVSAVLPWLKKKYGKVEVISQPPQHVVFENNPHIDKLTMKPYSEERNHLYWFDRSGEYAFFANLTHTCEATGALFKGQTQFWWPAETRRKLCGRSYLEMVADVVAAPYETLEPNFFPTELERKGGRGTQGTGWRPLCGMVLGWFTG